MKNKISSTVTALSISNLNKSFDEKIIFRDFNLKLPNRGLYILSGNSGIGKTTLLRIISGLDRECTGEISVSGKISFCFQEHRLFDNLTMLDNLTQICYKKPTDENVDEAKELLYTLKFSGNDFALYPRELSGGMKQRISLARALLFDSEILLLDEPTKELDGELCDIALELIKREAERRLVILVTHRTEDISNLNAQIIEL